ncbi:hypothetical protein K490DRAFT_12394, partial [Saccharata proteae CBS 121410]
LDRHAARNNDQDYFDENAHGNGVRYDDGEEGEEDEEDDDDIDAVLPIFSAEHLDRLPIYNITHSIRLLVVQRCETTLSWDQLRSPQISQFLVKPIQQDIRSSHFSRATLYALIANCLQFQKEGQMNPGNLGVSKTRGMVCELLAMRLIKEFSTRELIDALSYDFDPLQGLNPPTVSGRPTSTPRLARISTVEIAIRAQAKKFLAHPLVVQQLEAVWAGTIVFHSAADNLHRQLPAKRQVRRTNYGTMQEVSSQPSATDKSTGIRRTVTLYDPREASLFKLSRLRVPRYRQLFSTCSFAIMLGLFVAVLHEKSLDITVLEIIFWFWSAGFMLDEVVGFTEQGFNLYILSVWNAFDLGILALFVVYYVLRLYGILMPDVRKRYVANMAYDVLGSTAVLLFPRLFSVLDHYRYFSQLLIAFRMMAMDLVAIMILILISCSGFFVAFSLAFGDQGLASPSAAAYALFQMLMGFTPAAWEIWDTYNPLGKFILTLFLFICHFLIVTILITVLTNSFMAVVANANEEHQFLFAVNTISMVKSDALFSYIAPTNVIGWLLTPLRFVLPFRRFLRLNRTIIKITHFPVLFAVFVYERIILSRMAFQPEELVEQRGRVPLKGPAFTLRSAGEVFSPGNRLREPSIATFQKDRALDEVFRRPFKEPILEQTGEETIAERRKSSNVVRDWMQGVGHEGGASSPEEEPRSVLERLETRRPRMRRARTAQRLAQRDFSTATRSIASDPDVYSHSNYVPRSKAIREEEEEFPDMDMDDQPQQTDADGDDELITNDDDDRLTIGQSTHLTEQLETTDSENRPIPIHRTATSDDEAEEYFHTPMAPKVHTPIYPGSVSSATRARLIESTNAMTGAPQPHRAHHDRNLSSNTIQFSPLPIPGDHTQTSSSPSRAGGNARPSTAIHSGTATPRRTLRPPRPMPITTASLTNPPPATTNSSRPRPITRGKLVTNHSSPNMAPFFLAQNRGHRNPSFNAMALDLASDLGDNRPRGDGDALGGSFGTQLEMAAMRARRRKEEEQEEEEEERGRVNRIMLARMNTLEEGFREVIREVRGLK